MVRGLMLFPVVLLTLLAACAGTAGLYRESPDVAVDIVAYPDGERLTLGETLDAVERCRVVYLGENHNNDHHHAFQAEMVRALHRRDARLLIGMEMFQRPYQGALDRFIAGETTEEEFLRESEYFGRWRWDWKYYRPILLYARAHGIPVIALNAPAEANHKVSRGGGLTALTEEERRWVARDVDLTIAAHHEFVMGIFKNHPMRPGFNLDDFYASQCLWEDTMAESVATALDAHPGHRMAVIVGSGHVRCRYGIPLRAQRRGATPYAVFVGMEAEPDGTLDLEDALKVDLGDFLYFTAPAPKDPPTPKLGVNLHPPAGGAGLRVTAVAEDGIAKASGVEPGDLLVELDGRTLATVEDLRIALALHEGTRGEIVVERGGERVTLPFRRPAVEP